MTPEHQKAILERDQAREELLAIKEAFVLALGAKAGGETLAMMERIASGLMRRGGQ